MHLPIDDLPDHTTTNSAAAGPYFSVVIPVYNRAGMIRETLDSVFAQTWTNYEVIVADDGSTDGTGDVLATYGDRIRVVTQNSGPGRSPQSGYRASPRPIPRLSR